MCVLSHARLFGTPWTVACQAPLTVEFFRQEYWGGAISYSRGSSWPRDRTCISCISYTGRQTLYHHTTVYFSWKEIKHRITVTPKFNMFNKIENILIQKDFPSGTVVRNPPTKWETWVWSLGWEDPLEKEMATHSSILLPGKSHGQKSLVGYSPWGCKRVGHSLAMETTENSYKNLHLNVHSSVIHNGQKVQTTLVFVHQQMNG